MPHKKVIPFLMLLYWNITYLVPSDKAVPKATYEALKQTLKKEQDSLTLDIKYWPCGLVCDEANIPILKAVQKYLEENPTNTFQVETYTDCRGGDAENVKLSLERSTLIRDWLIENGIVKERLVAKGFGGRRPISNCKCSECTPLQHVVDKRVVFRLINIFAPEGLKERVVLEQPWLKKKDNFKGVVAVRTCVGKNGKVSGIQLDKEETTAKDEDYIQQVLATVKDWRFTRSPKEIQCGMIRYDFEL